MAVHDMSFPTSRGRCKLHKGNKTRQTPLGEQDKISEPNKRASEQFKRDIQANEQLKRANKRAIQASKQVIKQFK